MQYEQEAVEITLSILDSQTLSMDNGIDHRNLITVHLVVWTQQAVNHDSIKLCSTIEKSTEFPHMEHIARTSENDLTPTPYGIQWNCS